MVPPDGLCDFIYFMEVIYDDANKNIRPSMGSIAFEVIKKAASHYRQTTFGTSLEVTEMLQPFMSTGVNVGIDRRRAGTKNGFAAANVAGACPSQDTSRLLDGERVKMRVPGYEFAESAHASPAIIRNVPSRRCIWIKDVIRIFIHAYRGPFILSISNFGGEFGEKETLNLNSSRIK
ncbi:hypothetical protein HPB48_006357 [Haemaphysalis longicornis]|uniref:Uncharacterized protein n=1 Tax=Haemaphysalis longicornis TaxID=44386 RepID=A0A9J6GA99_HAELO|nr:hypothetical protein HPB48_006357 [Haemaphysalis longicornis]